MTFRFRQPDHRGWPTSQTDRNVGGSNSASHSTPPPHHDPMGTCAFDGAGKEGAVSLTRRRVKSLLVPGSRTRAATTAVLLVLLAGACSDGGEAAGIATTTTRVQTTTTTAAVPEQTVEEQILERYLAFWEARLEANTEPVNPEHPDLPAYADEGQLGQVILETTQRRDQGLALRAAEDPVGEHRVKIVSVEGDTATLQACVTDDDVVYRVATGEVVNDRIATRNIEAMMRRLEGDWKLVHTRVVQTWEGVAGCAKSPDF